MNEKVEAFRKLHEGGCFVIPNPWDLGTAIALQRLGFKALATTSAGFAFAHGLPDDVGVIPRDLMLAHIRDMVAATALPVNADFQAAFADDTEAVARNVALCIDTGVAGLSVEDATGDRAAPLFERGLAIERFKAARAAVDASGVPVVLTARCEAWLVGHPDARKVALDRMVAFADAGADCLFAPGIRRAADIQELVRAVAPRPVNVLVAAPSPELSVARLADLGVRRISVGSALARTAWGAFLRAAQMLAGDGSFDGFSGAAPFADLNAMFQKKA